MRSNGLVDARENGLSAHTPAVFILGGGVMQLPAIEAARRMGYSVHVADGNSACPGATEADHFHHADLRDERALLQEARHIPSLKAVFTAGTDFSTSVASITEALQLPGITRETSRNATDKGVMRSVLCREGVRVPRFVTLQEATDDEILRQTGQMRLPLVVKPVDSMGARGVVRVDDRAMLSAAVTRALTYSRSHQAIVEEFIPGREYSLDAIVVDGEVHITGVAERHIFFPPYFIEMGHTIPAPLSTENRVLLESAFIAAIRALGIHRGAAKGDVFLDYTGDEPKAVVGEVAARLSGGYMSGWTYPLASGVPLTEIGIRVALGETPPPSLFTPTRNDVVAERALISCPGTVDRIISPKIDHDEYVSELFIRSNAGDRVAPPSNNVEKIANAIARGRNREEAEHHALCALDRVEIHLTLQDEETEAFLFSDSRSGVFSRYAPAIDEYRRALEALPWYQGSEDTVLRRFQRRPVLPVLMPSRGEPWRPEFWTSCYPVLPADIVLMDLLERGIVTAEDDDTDYPALGRVFWCAYRACGRQGVVYLLDSLRAGRVPLEVTG